MKINKFALAAAFMTTAMGIAAGASSAEPIEAADPINFTAYAA